MTMAMQEDPFAAVRLNKRQASQQQAEKPMKEQGQDPFAEVRIKKVEGMPWLYEGGRHAARLGSRIAETIGGIPGDVQSLVESGVFAGLEKLIGHEVTPEMREESRRLTERAPSTKELREISKEVTGEFTEPQSDIEKTGDEIVSTLASLLGPMKFRNALGVSLGSQLAKEGLKVLGTEEGTQEAGKLGTMFLISAMNPGGAMKYASKQYEKANELSKGASVIASQLKNNLKDLETNLVKGVSTTEKNTVLKPIRELLEKIHKDGKIPVHELTAAKRDVNKLIGEPETLKGAKRLLLGLGKEIDKAIKPYEKVNVPFSKAYRPANEIFGAVMQGNKASNFVKKYLGSHSILGTAMAEASAGYPEAIIPTIAGVAGAHGLARSIDFFTRLKKSSELRKYYGHAMIAAAKEDAAALRLYSSRIDELMEKDQSSSR